MKEGGLDEPRLASTSERTDFYRSPPSRFMGEQDRMPNASSTCTGSLLFGSLRVDSLSAKTSGFIWIHPALASTNIFAFCANARLPSLQRNKDGKQNAGKKIHARQCSLIASQSSTWSGTVEMVPMLTNTAALLYWSLPRAALYFLNLLSSSSLPMTLCISLR